MNCRRCGEEEAYLYRLCLNCIIDDIEFDKYMKAGHKKACAAKMVFCGEECTCGA
ncbi:MAG: hypothetical protein GY853_13575 [PVC group bacterium]|nr:hypothetical protein [PVC group bacterium]